MLCAHTKIPLTYAQLGFNSLESRCLMQLCLYRQGATEVVVPKHTVHEVYTSSTIVPTSNIQIHFITQKKRGEELL
jgi:hypothetical protein